MASCLGGAHIRTEDGPILNFVDPLSGEGLLSCSAVRQGPREYLKESGEADGIAKLCYLKESVEAVGCNALFYLEESVEAAGCELLFYLYVRVAC